jgi:hypothetical protein
MESFSAINFACFCFDIDDITKVLSEKLVLLLRPVKLMEVSTPQGPVLLLEVSTLYTTGVGAAPGHVNNTGA